MINVLEIKGYESYQAVLSYNKLLLGLKMLPLYYYEEYDSFYARVREKSAEDQKKLLKEAALFVNLTKEEVQALLCFCADANGVPYQPANMKSLTADQIIEMIVAVSFEISKIKIDFVTEEEKKKSVTSQ